MNIITPKPSRAGSVDFVDGHTRLYGILGILSNRSEHLKQ